MRSRTIRINPDLVWISALGVLALVAAVVLSRQNPVMVVFIPAALIVACLFLTNDELCLAAMIMVLPLAASVLMATQFIPVPGARINNLLFLLLLAGFLLNRKLDFTGMQLAVFFYAGSLLFLITAIVRTEHVAGYAVEFWMESYDPVKFFLSHGLIPMLTTIPFLMIISRIRTQEEIQRVVHYVALSVGLFAAVIIGIYFIAVPFGSDFFTTREIIGQYLGMHGNNLADFIIVGFPLILSLALVSRGVYKKWLYLAVFMALIAVAIIYSRMAYGVILVSIIAVMVITRQHKKMIPLFILLVLIIIIVPGVAERALTGLAEGEMDLITAGRTDRIWRPILGEWWERAASEPLKVIFGYGRYGIIDLQVFKNHRMFLTNHAHNMFLDTLVDTGVAGLLFYLSFIGYVVVRLGKALLRRLKSGNAVEIHLAAGIFVAILGFIARGMTDSVLLPHLTNSYFYIVMALSFVLLRQEKLVREEGGRA